MGVTSAPNSTRPQSRLYPDIFDRMHRFFTQVHLLFDSSAEGQYVTLLLPGPLKFKVVALAKVLSMVLIDLFKPYSCSIRPGIKNN